MFEIVYTPRKKPPVDDEEYAYIRKKLSQAQEKFSDFAPTIPGENKTSLSKLKNKIQYVAEKEGINVKVSRKGENLVLNFSGAKGSSRRMSDDQAADLVMAAMKKGVSYSRGELAKSVSLTPVKASKALKLLASKKKVVTEGKMPKVKYRLK